MRPCVTSAQTLVGYSGHRSTMRYSSTRVRAFSYGPCTIQKKQEAIVSVCPARMLRRRYSSIILPRVKNEPTFSVKSHRLKTDDGLSGLRFDTFTSDNDASTVVRVFIQNARTANALTGPILRLLTTTFRDLALDDKVRCVILTGGSHFSSGMVSWSTCGGPRRQSVPSDRTEPMLTP